MNLTDFSVSIYKYRKKLHQLTRNLLNTIESQNKFASLILNFQSDRQIAFSVDFQTSPTLAGY